MSSIRPTRVEVITGVQRRRRWTPEQKLEIVKQTNEPGSSVSYLYCDDERLATMLLQIWCLSDVHWARLERYIKYELQSPNSESP